MGPVILYMSISMAELPVSTRNYAIHFIPAILALAGELIFQAQSTAAKQAQIHPVMNHLGADFLNIVVILATSHVLLYFFFIIFLQVKVQLDYDLRYVPFVWSILVTPVLGIMLILAGFLGKSMVLIHIGAALITITCTFFYIFTARYPVFFVSLKNEIKTKRYANTQLTSIDVEMVKNRLSELMNNEEHYKDDELRLGSPAEELRITPHQLSRILNEQFQKNFNQFINEYRIQAAKKLLVQEPNRSVLRVAIEVGSTSKTTFNSQFV